MMCGDGTNDVGALKKAHVGVSIINPVPAPRSETRKSTAVKANGRSSVAARKKSSAKKKRRKKESSKGLAEMLEARLEETEEPEMVRFGDASIASPFTSRETSIRATLAVIRQGRCTLVQVRLLLPQPQSQPQSPARTTLPHTPLVSTRCCPAPPPSPSATLLFRSIIVPSIPAILVSIWTRRRRSKCSRSLP